MTPLWSADARNAPECVNCIVRTAESCACKIVSKLNVRPFHSVNSPLVEPVSIRRASGVHCDPFSQRIKHTIHSVKMWGLTTTQLTGHLILFVDVCTNLVHSEVEGLSGYAFGGRSYTRDILSLCILRTCPRLRPYIDDIRRCWPQVRQICRVWPHFAHL